MCRQNFRGKAGWYFYREANDKTSVNGTARKKPEDSTVIIAGGMDFNQPSVVCND